MSHWRLFNPAARVLVVTIVNPLSLSELALSSVRSLAFEPMIHFWCYVVHASSPCRHALQTASRPNAVRMEISRSRG